MSSAKAVPKQADLERELFFVKKKWYNIGLQLGVSEDRLEEIESECNGNFEKGLRYMLREWRKQLEPDPTWAGLVNALRVCTVNEQDLAANLEERFVESTDHHQALASPPNLLNCSAVMRPDEVPDAEVQRQLDHLYGLFEKLTMKVYTYLSEIELDRKEFAVLVSSQPPSWKIKRPRQIPDVDFHRIIDPNTEFFQMFCIVKRYVSWHNYELLEKIVNRFGNADLKLQMEKYRTELGDFEQHTSAEVLKNIQFAIAQPDSVAIFAILSQHNLNQFKVSDIRLLKHKIAKKADLEQAAVSTYMIVESSVKIVFLIPNALAPYVMVSALAVSPLLTSQGPLPGDICKRTIYTMNTEEVFCLMGRTVTPPALQKSGSRSRMRQMLSSSASECSRLAEDGLPVIARTQVKVHQHKVIMNGDSAVICKAQFLSLSCAAKYIHPELSKCSKWQVEDFERGCKLLQNIRHPNIVLPFGICYDESVVGPILIMELMDLNLKDFLEKSHQSPLPLHSQLGLCSDVAQGLEFLHSNNIIHSNLTATNILVKGGRAKIGGVTSLQVNAPEAELSVGSGAAVGLPRKSFSSGIYDEDVDCFSFGVLALHVITREMPQPLTKILEPEDATISEVTRYKISLEKVDDNHPMRQLIVDCLNDVSFQRPSAGELCKRLSEMSKSAGYRDSQMADLLSTKLVNLQIKFTQNAIHKKEQEQRKLLEQLDEEKREAETKMEVDRENMQNTIAMLTLHNKDLERKIAAASKELDDKKTEVKKISAEETEKSATMLAKIKELETEKAYYKKKAEESDSGFAQYLSQQN